MPLVSIITPTRNRPALLSEAIQSVLSQTFSDLEMLIVDDGSHPSVQPVVERFADSRLRYFFQQHGGCSAARNLAMQAARGKYIAFLDDDDLYHPEKLAREAAYLKTHPEIDMVGAGYRLLDRKNELITVHQPWLYTSELNANNCLNSSPLITCSVLLHRNVLHRLDHWFDPSFQQGEDTDFFMRLILTGARFAWVKKVHSDYRLLGKRDLTILLKIYPAYRRVLDKIFVRQDLPAHIAAQRQDVLTRLPLKFAWQAYTYQLDATAQRLLLRALLQEPRLANDLSYILLDELEKATRFSYYVEDPIQFIRYVFEHLPSPLRHLARHQQEMIDRVSRPPNPDSPVSYEDSKYEHGKS